MNWTLGIHKDWKPCNAPGEELMVKTSFMQMSAGAAHCTFCLLTRVWSCSSAIHQYINAHVVVWLYSVVSQHCLLPVSRLYFCYCEASSSSETQDEEEEVLKLSELFGEKFCESVRSFKHLYDGTETDGYCRTAGRRPDGKEMWVGWWWRESGGQDRLSSGCTA